MNDDFDEWMNVKENILMHPASNELSENDRWREWQQQVLAIIRSDFRSVLADVEWDDIDWETWQPLFEQGASPREAVQTAFGRVA
jgi:hypothetical protein